jgi:hypothetical protein
LGQKYGRTKDTFGDFRWRLTNEEKGVLVVMSKKKSKNQLKQENYKNNN